MFRSDQDKRDQKTGRIVAVTIAVAALATLFAPAITASLGLGVRYEMLIYLFALAAMGWAVFVACGLWRARNR